MANALTESRVTSLESMMADLVAAVAQTTRTVERLSLEMSDFKKGMSDFKDEMSDWRDKTDAALEEGRRERRALNKQLGEIANKQGRMAEDLVAPSVCRILRQVLGVPEELVCVENVRVRRRHPHGNTVREFDGNPSVNRV